MVTMLRRTPWSGNLPAETTSFIGRRRELSELRKKLAHAPLRSTGRAHGPLRSTGQAQAPLRSTGYSAARLVSLVGPGGVGKTRLAIRAATDLGRGFRGGAWLVELAEVRNSALVSNAVLAALDLRDQAATHPLDLLLAYLRDKELLLVVDNCEHLLAAAAQVVSEVISAAPGVRV